MDFDTFYTDNEAMVRKIVASKLSRYRDHVDDCCQIVWLKVSKVMNTSKWAEVENDRPTHWLAKVAKTTALDYRKSLAKRPEVSLDALPECAIQYEPDQGNNQEDSIYDVLMAGVEQLPPRTQLVTKAYYLYDLTVAEIANLLHVAHGTVWWHLNRGRKSLQRFLRNGRSDHV